MPKLLPICALVLIGLTGTLRADEPLLLHYKAAKGDKALYRTVTESKQGMTINGMKIDKLEDAVCAFETSTNAQDIIEFLPNHVFECLGRQEAVQAKDRILKAYAIASDRRL